MIIHSPKIHTQFCAVNKKKKKKIQLLITHPRSRLGITLSSEARRLHKLTRYSKDKNCAGTRWQEKLQLYWTIFRLKVRWIEASIRAVVLLKVLIMCSSILFKIVLCCNRWFSMSGWVILPGLYICFISVVLFYFVMIERFGTSVLEVQKVSLVIYLLRSVQEFTEDKPQSSVIHTEKEIFIQWKCRDSSFLHARL